MKDKELKKKLQEIKDSINSLILMLGIEKATGKYETKVDNNYEKRGQNGN